MCRVGPAGYMVAHEILVSAQGPLVLGFWVFGLRVWGQGLTIRFQDQIRNQDLIQFQDLIRFQNLIRFQDFKRFQDLKRFQNLI